MKLAFYEDYILVLKKKREESRRKDEFVYKEGFLFDAPNSPPHWLFKTHSAAPSRENHFKFKELIPYTHITALYRDTSSQGSTCRLVCGRSLYFRFFGPEPAVRGSLYKAAVQHILQLYVRVEHEKYFLIFVIWQHYNLKRFEGRKWSRGQTHKDNLEIFFNYSRQQSMINLQVRHWVTV